MIHSNLPFIFVLTAFFSFENKFYLKFHLSPQKGLKCFLETSDNAF